MAILHLFDVDGTLLHVSEELALAQAFGELHGPGLDLSFLPTAPISDMGYVGSVLDRHLRRASLEAEVRAVLDRFVEVLHQRTHAGELEVRPVAGAAAFVHQLAARAPLALSTGCVESSARLKLDHLGMNTVFRCGGFSVGERSRADIVRRAVAAAEQTYGERFDKVVLFGDGTWDLDSAREAGVGFVGINEGEHGRERLHQAGAQWVFDGYGDAAAIEQAVASL
jgi:phosphoglycolate phosphatase-like HAD superfamily hydrolase